MRIKGNFLDIRTTYSFLMPYQLKLFTAMKQCPSQRTLSTMRC
jgi:hypothetical protein